VRLGVDAPGDRQPRAGLGVTGRGTLAE
jgi:hypothetical protein